MTPVGEDKASGDYWTDLSSRVEHSLVPVKNLCFWSRVVERNFGRKRRMQWNWDFFCLLFFTRK